MADSFHCLAYHFIWSTKNRTPWLADTMQPRLWEYLSGIAQQKKMIPLRIGGWYDHIHALVKLPPNLDVSKAMQLIKGPSSKWLRESFPRELAGFECQDGYGVFTVSQSQIVGVSDYIKNQREHHRGKTFQEEYLLFLQRHSIEWNPTYVWG